MILYEKGGYPEKKFYTPGMSPSTSCIFSILPTIDTKYLVTLRVNSIRHARECSSCHWDEMILRLGFIQPLRDNRVDSLVPQNYGQRDLLVGNCIPANATSFSITQDGTTKLKKIPISKK